MIVNYLVGFARGMATMSIRRCSNHRVVFKVGALAVCAIIATSSVDAQSILRGSGTTGTVHILNSDLAVFEAGINRRDLPCRVDDAKAQLGFDRRFHAGYQIRVPLKELSGEGNRLTMVLRVAHVDSPDSPIYLTQRTPVPPIVEDAKGDAYLYGNFDLGEGVYSVALVIRDLQERVCSKFWEVDAMLEGGQEGIELMLEPGSVEETETAQFRPVAPVARVPDSESLRIKLLVNFAPQDQDAATLQPRDTSALVSVLRTISGEPRIGKFSLVAFNLHEQRVLYRQEDADLIDFPALGASLESLKLGTIDLGRLTDKHGDTRFLSNLLREELSGSDDVDAFVIAGPKAFLDKGVPQEDIEDLKEGDVPVFYLNYNLDPARVPWRGSISEAVRRLNGIEYTIRRPRDLWNAVTEVVDRIDELRSRRRASLVAEKD